MRNDELNRREGCAGDATPPGDPDTELIAVRRLVQELPDDVLSLTWRSELNERLLACARQRPAARPMRWAWWTGLVGAMACAWTIWALGSHQTRPQPSASGTIELALVAARQESASGITLQTAGPGLERTSANESAALYRHSDLDIESL